MSVLNWKLRQVSISPNRNPFRALTQIFRDNPIVVGMRILRKIVGITLLPRGDYFHQLFIDVVQGYPIVTSPSLIQFTGSNQFVIGLPPEVLTVVMRTKTPL